MSDPLRAEIERLAEEWEKEAARRRKDAARPGEPPSSRRMLECGAAFELSHAALLRAALRSTEPPAGLKSEEYRTGYGDGVLHAYAAATRPCRHGTPRALCKVTCAKCGHGCRAHYWDGHICQSLDGEKHACGCDWVEPSSPPEPEGGGRCPTCRRHYRSHSTVPPLPGHEKFDSPYLSDAQIEAGARGGAPSPSPRQEPRGDYAPCHGCFFYQGKHSPRCDARGERVAPGVPCSDCRPIPRHSSLDCPVCRPAPEEAATLPKRALRPLTGDALKDACRRLSPPPALEDMDIATPEEAATTDTTLAFLDQVVKAARAGYDALHCEAKPGLDSEARHLLCLLRDEARRQRSIWLARQAAEDVAAPVRQGHGTWDDEALAALERIEACRVNGLGLCKVCADDWELAKAALRASRERRGGQS